MMSPNAAVEPLESRIAPAVIVALSENNSLLRFDSATPDVIDATVPITGLGAGETVVAMDSDPVSGMLYGLAIDGASQGKIYRLHAGNGTATLVAALQPKPLDDAPYAGLSGDHFSFDFASRSLSPGMVRIVSDSGQNLQLTNLASGMVETQPAPHYLATDPNFGAPLALSGAAYYDKSSIHDTINPDGYYGIDVAADRLVYGSSKTQIDLGEYVTVGTLDLETDLTFGFDVSGSVGMDITPVGNVVYGNTLYASLNAGGTTKLYTVIKTTAGLYAVNTIGDGTTPIRDIAFVETVWAGLGENNLWSNPDNWSSGLAPVPNSTIVIKSGSGVLETVNDYAPFTQFESIRLEGQHVVSGSPIKLDAGFSLNGLATVNLDFQFNLARLSTGFGVSPGSELTLGGAIDIEDHHVSFNGRGQVTIAGPIVGRGTLEVNGPTAIVNGTEADSEHIHVFDGSLFLTGDHSERQIVVRWFGRFAGGAPVASVLSESFGILSPGGSELGSIVVEQTLTTHPITPFEFQLGEAGGQNDFIEYRGDTPLFLRGELILSDSADSKTGSQFTLVKNQGADPIGEGFYEIEEGQIITTNHHRYRLTYTGGDGNDVVLVQIPEAVISPDGRTGTFTDVDGDLVRVTVSQGTLTPENFVLMELPGNEGGELVRLNLTGLPDGTKISIKATPQDINGDRRLDGDGYVNVGSIDATGVILSDVLVDGNLTQIKAGKTATTPGVNSLSVHSLGSFDAFAWNLADEYVSSIVGNLGRLTVTADVSEAFLDVHGNIGPVTIGGSIIGGSRIDSGKIAATGNIASIKLRGNIEGSSGEGSGMIEAGGGVGNLTIGGSVRGGSAVESGSVVVGNLTTLKIGGNLVGGSEDRSGGIFVTVDLVNATIKGSIQGGDSHHSGSIVALGTVGRLTVGHSMEGGAGVNSGSLISETNIQLLKVGGTLSGDVIARTGALGPVSIGGSLLGTASDHTLISADNIGRITVNGDASHVDIASETTISAVSIAAQATSVGIFAVGTTVPERAKDALAISSVKIGGSFVDSKVVAGFSLADQMYLTPDVVIGSVSIGGAFIQSDIAAGIAPGLDGEFGTADDQVIANGGNAAILSRIASITIKGQAYEGGGSDRHSGIIAESLGKIRLGRVSLPLTSGLDEFHVGHGTNLHIREESLTVNG